MQSIQLCCVKCVENWDAIFPHLAIDMKNVGIWEYLIKCIMIPHQLHNYLHHVQLMPKLENMITCAMHSDFSSMCTRFYLTNYKAIDDLESNSEWC